MDKMVNFILYLFEFVYINIQFYNIHDPGENWFQYMI
jgi:hypothetical protein